MQKIVTCLRILIPAESPFYFLLICIHYEIKNVELINENFDVNEIIWGDEFLPVSFGLLPVHYPRNTSFLRRFISLYLSSLHIYANKLTNNQLKSELFIVLNENKHVLKYSKFYVSYRHLLVACLMQYFGLKAVLLFFKIFTRQN